MKIHFITPTRISQINLTTIGDSEKRGDETTIGQFSSGLAYSTALLLRDNVRMYISVYGGEKDFGDGYEKYDEHYTYSTQLRDCESTGKSKETIDIHYTRDYHGVCTQMCFSDPRESEEAVLETGFALQLGYNWELYMALRELWSNMLDEKGHCSEEGYPQIDYGTIITLEFDESNEFYNIWNNRHLYINQQKPIYTLSDKVEVLENKENYLRIYKQNILVYKDENVPSRFAWNIKLGDLDERRILSNIYSVEGSIVDAIRYTKNEEFLREIITSDFKAQDKEFLSDRSPYGSASDLIHDICFEVYEQYGQVYSYDWLIKQVKDRKDCKIAGKRITTVEDSLWSYSKTVTVETTPETHHQVALTTEECFEISPLQKEINTLYKFNLDIEVKRANLKGSKVVADKYNNCLIIDENFDVETDFPEFIVQYIDLTEKSNVVKALSEYICKLLKK